MRWQTTQIPPKPSSLGQCSPSRLCKHFEHPVHERFSPLAPWHTLKFNTRMQHTYVKDNVNMFQCNTLKFHTRARDLFLIILRLLENPLILSTCRHSRFQNNQLNNFVYLSCPQKIINYGRQNWKHLEFGVIVIGLMYLTDVIVIPRFFKRK